MAVKRLNNYDLLRVVATYAVVLLHVTGLWIISSKGINNHAIITLAYLYNDLSRFAVPCFLMLSGALLMSEERQLSFWQFYKKSFIKLGIPTIIFSFIYTLYMFFAYKYGVYNLNGSLLSTTLLTRFLRGTPMFHMWFMYMLIWIYIFVPFVKIIKSSISNTTYTRMGVVFCIVSTLSASVSSGRYVAWDIGRSFEFLSYFIIGDIIFMNISAKNNLKGVFFIMGGSLIEIFAGFSAAYKLNNLLKLGTAILPVSPISPLTPLATIASVLYFIGFSLLNIKSKKNLRKLSDNSFNIYLIHALVIEFLIRIPVFKMGMRYILNSLLIAICLPLIALIIYLISYLGCLIYTKLLDNFRNKKSVIDN